MKKYLLLFLVTASINLLAQVNLTNKLKSYGVPVKDKSSSNTPTETNTQQPPSTNTTQSATNEGPKLTGNEKIEYFDSNWQPTKDKSKAAYYRIIEYATPTTCKGTIKYFYANGTKQSECSCVYVDPSGDQAKDKLNGAAYFYNEQGDLKEVDFFDNGARITYLNAYDYNNSKYKMGDKVDVLAASGDQDIWIPATVTLMKGSNAYRVKTDLLGWGDFNTYGENLRTPQPITTKIILPVGAPEPIIQDLAKVELLKLRPEATVLQNVMNGDNWQNYKDDYNRPSYRVKNGYILYNYKGTCYHMHFLYDEPYENGAYQKIKSLKLETETPVVCK